MRAIVQDTYGTAAVLELRDVAEPVMGSHEVLVGVHAAGVNPADWAVMSGLPYIARPVYGLRRPKIGIRGTDVAGHVVAVGTEVTRLHPGDEVFGWCSGSFADYVAVAEDALAPKPTNLTFDQAAAVPMAGFVALQALRDHGKVRSGQHVLINGAAGGVGTFAVQIAKALGAQVTGVCSTTKLNLVRALGADQVIDYTREDFTRNGQHYDVILDNVGNHSLTDLRRALTPSGTLVPNGGRFDHHWFAGGGRVVSARVSSPFVSQTLRTFLVAPRLADLLVLTTLIEAGKLTPVIDRSYPVGETPDAIRYVGEGHVQGKVVVVVRAPGRGAAEAADALRQQAQGHAQELREIGV